MTEEVRQVGDVGQCPRSRGVGVEPPRGGGRRVSTEGSRVERAGFSGASSQGVAELSAARRLTRRLLGCPLCGRAGGAMSEGAEYCHRCAAFYDPTPLQLWSFASGVDLKNLPALAGVSKRTVMRAARGIRISDDAAAKLRRVTKIPVRAFTAKARPA